MKIKELTKFELKKQVIAGFILEARTNTELEYIIKQLIRELFKK